MNEKCDKYESLFIFNEEKFESHLETCKDCREEFEKMEKISNLIQEAKPLYFKKKKEKIKTRQKLAACFLFFAVFSISCLSILNYDNRLTDTFQYGQTLTAEDFGFPVDSYGLIMVDE